MKLWAAYYESAHEVETFVIRSEKKPTKKEAVGCAEKLATAIIYLNYDSIKQTTEKNIRSKGYKIVGVGK